MCASNLTRLQFPNAIFPGPSQLEFQMSKLFARFLNDESGATAIEYGLIAAGISLAIIAAVNGIGGNLSTKFGDINTSLK